MNTIANIGDKYKFDYDEWNSPAPSTFYYKMYGIPYSSYKYYIICSSNEIQIETIVQRSNFLSHCDIDDNCSGDVVIEDSLVTRSSIGVDAEAKDSIVQRADVGGGFCTACGESVPDGAKFCNECEVKLQ